MSTEKHFLDSLTSQDSDFLTKTALSHDDAVGGLTHEDIDNVSKDDLHLVRRALDVVELMVSDASVSAICLRHTEGRSMLATDSTSLATMQTSVIASALLIGLREIAKAIRERGTA